MAITLKVMYWENDATVVRESSIDDTTTMDNDTLMPKTNVIFMIFSSKVQGVDTRVGELVGFDNYQVGLREIGNFAHLYGYDDLPGGWWRIQNPFANDGYLKALTHPLMYPFGKANEIFWQFTGIQLTQQEFDGTQAARDALH